MSDPVSASGLVVSYDGRPVLRGVTFRIPPGELVAVLGANGSGKSTLVKAVLGLLPLAGGEVRLFGTPRRRFREWRRIGYVPQRLGAGSGVPATVREVVSSGRLARRGLLRPATSADRTALAGALTRVGLPGRAADPVATLSGGQQQRVLIARALAGEPELLVLDEPTAGVDLTHQEVLTSVLADLVSGGTAVLVVLHEIGTLGDLIDRGVVLREGRVAVDGPLNELRHRAGGDLGHHEPERPDSRWLDGTVGR